MLYFILKILLKMNDEIHPKVIVTLYQNLDSPNTIY
jgi:hypothetical protein